MKKIIIFFFLAFYVLFSYSQNDFSDEVYPANGEKPYLNCQILEIENDNIITFIFQDEEYKLKAISIKKNGTYIDLSSFVSEDINHYEAEITTNSEKSKYPIKDRKYAYSALGVGFGNAYGVLGFQFQFRDGKTFGFGGHLGGGVIPRIGEMNKISFGFSAGVKIFVYKPLYFDVTYGVVGVSQYSILLGPSVLTGADLFFGKTVGLNLAGGLSFYQDEIAPTFDFGLLIKLPSQKK